MEGGLTAPRPPMFTLDGQPPPVGGPPGMPTGMPMDPSMMGGGQPPLPGMPPMPPEMNGMPTPPPGTGGSVQDPMIDGTVFEQAVDALRNIAQNQGEDIAKALLLSFPKAKLYELADALRNDPVRYDFLLSVMPDINDPVYPKSFKIPKKPTAETVREAVDHDMSQWNDVTARMQETLDLFHMEVFGRTKTFDPADDEEYYSPGLSDEVRAIGSLIGGVKPRYRVLTENPVNREDCTRMSAALDHWDREFMHRYSISGGGDFNIDATLYLLLRGYVSWLGTINHDSSQSGYCFREVLVDPATVYPFWDNDGLVRATRKYTDTYANIIADYETDGSVERFLRKSFANSGGNLVISDTAEVTVYYDRWWFCLLVDDKMVGKPFAHQYGFTPWVIVGSGMGEPVGVVGSDYAMGYPQSSRVHEAARNNRARYKNVDWMHFRKKQHQQREATMSIFYTLLQKTGHPSWVLYQNPLAPLADPKINDRAGHINRLVQGDELRPLISAADQRVLNVLFQAQSEDEVTNRLPVEMFGTGSGVTQSGHALEGIYESGKDKIAAIVNAVEHFHTERARMRMHLYRDWGHQIYDEEENLGQMPVPYGRARETSRYESSSFNLTPLMIKRAGLNIEADVENLRLASLGPLGNSASIWVGMKAMSRREAMELRGVRDTDGIMREIRTEDAMADEMIAKAQQLRDLQNTDYGLYILVKEMMDAQKKEAAMAPPMPPPGQEQMSFAPANQTNQQDMYAMGGAPSGVTGRPPGPIESSPAEGQP